MRTNDKARFTRVKRDSTIKREFIGEILRENKDKIYAIITKRTDEGIAFVLLNDKNQKISTIFLNDYEMVVEKGNNDDEFIDYKEIQKLWISILKRNHPEKYNLGAEKYSKSLGI